MAGTCCGRRAARLTIEGINTGIDDLRESIGSPSGAAGLERDPDCACDPCMCPSDDVPCNARYLGDDLSDRGLQQALDRLVRHARQIQEAQNDACDCADRPRRPRVEDTETPERPPVPSPIAPPIPPPISLVNPPVDPVEPRDRTPSVLSFFDLPQEIRDAIYEHHFADARRLLTEIAAVRVRQDDEGTETRIRRYLRNTPREHRRFVLDHRRQRERPMPFDLFVTNLQREAAAITYEASADDDELAELPSDPLALLRVSRQMRYDAGAIFFERFRFTHPRNALTIDQSVHFGILAAEAFFTNRSASFLRQFRNIELDLGMMRRLQPSSDLEHTELTRFMMRNYGTGNYNWTNGIDRLGILANILGQMQFQHLTLNFTGTPPEWWERGITDPRNPVPGRSDPYSPWAGNLFNIRPRDRLRLQIHFRYEQLDPDTGHPRAQHNNDEIYNAIHTISTIRRFLLNNAQGLRDQYTGIRVLLWILYDWDAERRRLIEVLVECDDRYFEDSDSIVSRLQTPTFNVEGAPREPQFNYSATEFPPPYVAPMPPPPPPTPSPPPERVDGDDEEDEANPSILGP